MDRNERVVTDRHERTVPELVRDLLGHVGDLVRHEFDLARAEMSRKAGQAGSGIVMLCVALALGMAALVILLLSAVIALDAMMEGWLAALAVGGGAVIVAIVLALIGKSQLKARNLMPDRTIRSVREDARYAKGAMK